MHVSWFIRLTKTFSLVHTFDLLEDKHVDDVTIDDMVLYIIYITNKFYVAVHLFSDVKMWQEQESGTRGTAECANEVIDTYWHLQ